LEEKDRLLASIHDNETVKDGKFAELQKARAVNTDLDLKIKEMQ